MVDPDDWYTHICRVSPAARRTVRRALICWAETTPGCRSRTMMVPVGLDVAPLLPFLRTLTMREPPVPAGAAK